MKRLLTIASMLFTVSLVAAPVPQYTPLRPHEIDALLMQLADDDAKVAEQAHARLVGQLREAVVPITKLLRTSSEGALKKRLQNLYDRAVVNDSKLIQIAEAKFRAHPLLQTHVKVALDLRKALAAEAARLEKGKKFVWDEALTAALATCKYTSSPAPLARNDERAVFFRAGNHDYLVTWLAGANFRMVPVTVDAKTKEAVPAPIVLSGKELLTDAQREWLRYQTGSQGNFVLSLPCSIDTEEYLDHLHVRWERYTSFFPAFQVAMLAALAKEGVDAEQLPSLAEGAGDLMRKGLKGLMTFPMHLGKEEKK